MIKGCLMMVLLVAVAFGSLKISAGEIREIVVVGNSLTRHNKAADIGWNYDWGMAATGKEKDYVHLLYRKICDKLAGKQQKAPVLSLSRCVTEKDFSKWDPAPVSKADLIIIQLGDNYHAPLTPEKFQQPYEAMIRDFRGGRNPIIVCVSNWGLGKMSGMIRAAAEKQGAIFVSLEKIADDPQNKAKSEGNFTHKGVNWHPGDRGMASIADAIWRQLEPAIEKASGN